MARYYSILLPVSIAYLVSMNRAVDAHTITVHSVSQGTVVLLHTGIIPVSRSSYFGMPNDDMLIM